jgi:hypothetical protein
MNEFCLSIVQIPPASVSVSDGHSRIRIKVKMSATGQSVGALWLVTDSNKSLQSIQSWTIFPVSANTVGNPSVS